MMNKEGITKGLVKLLLLSPDKLKWTAQGLGMLRTYLSEEIRLHIWDASLKVPNASPCHDHPWHLHSTIVAGLLRNIRYERAPQGAGQEYQQVTIKCGEGGGAVIEPERLLLGAFPIIESYYSGMTYGQTKDEIHETLAEDGTVTIVERTFTADRDHAKVLWRGNGPYVSAEPRPATPEEVERVTKNALERWF